MMKKLSIVVLVLMISSTMAFAHEGSIGIYTSQAASDCDATINPFVQTPLYIMYFASDGGPDGINGCEFRVDNENPAQVQILPPTWADNTLANGDILTGIGIVFQTDCIGAGEPLVYIGSFMVLSLGAPPGWKLKILNDPRSQEFDGLNVSICDDLKSMQPVLGGWFIAQDGACNVGAESKSWGAIKSLYNE